MSSPYYRLYIESVLQLARSLVIKSEASADSINRSLMEMGYQVKLSEPRTWKYYLNLAGLYHPTDTVMTVSSLDTLETIEFTKERLAVHRATADGYQQGGDFYERLVERYPEQESLIRGILSPVDLDQAIAAEDGSILDYNQKLVESNETNLIPKLQQWVNGFLTRWHIPAYGIVDDLYNAAMLGVLYVNIPQVILNIRLENCRTNYVHSFHIREYLASNGRLDVYMEYLTKKQALFLYRNIRYIHRNAGKQQTFNLLMDRLLTDRGIPLASYEMRHNLERMPEELYPDVELILTYLNFPPGELLRDTRTVREILEKQVDVAVGNIDEANEALEYIPAEMKNSLVDRVPTKVYESIVTDYSNSMAYSYADLLLNHWLYTSTHQRYNTILSIMNPTTGQLTPLSAKEAFVLFLYSYNQACGVTLETVPDLRAVSVRRPLPPTFEELRAVADPHYVSDAVIESAFENQPSMGVYISTEAFRGFCRAVRDSLNKHQELFSLEEHLTSRGQIEGLLRRFYHDPVCQLADGEYYTDWLEERGFEPDKLSQFDYAILANEVLELATGANLADTDSLRELQTAMLRLMSQLSSYTVQFLQTINSDTFLKADWAMIRLGEVNEIGRVLLQLLGMSTIEVKDFNAHGNVWINCGIGNNQLFRDVGQISFGKVTWDPTLNETVISRVRTRDHSVTSRVYVRDFQVTERTL